MALRSFAAILLFIFYFSFFTFHSRAAQVTIPLGPAGLTPATNRSLTVTPYEIYGTSPAGPNYIPLTSDRSYGVSDVNGNFTLTLPPGIYQVDVKPIWGAIGTTEFYFYVDPSNAVQSAYSNLLTTTPNTWPPNQFAYSAAASDARYDFAGSAVAAAAAVAPGSYYSNIVLAVAIPNTNDLYVSIAGTTAANGHYHFQQTAFTAGAIYSNIVAIAGVPIGYVCADLGGSTGGTSGNFDQHPFYMGPTTNNVCVVSAPTPSCWYYSSVSLIAYYTNNDDSGFNSTGILPLPTVTYGTNFAQITDAVFMEPAFIAAEFTNGNLYVSAMGNDLLASNLQCAFATLNAAKNFAQAGQTINVEPGWFEGHDLLKNKVNWNGELGSTIAWDGSQLDLSVPRGIFDDYAGAVTCIITGDRLHYTAVQPSITSAIITTNPLTQITGKFNSYDGALYSIGNNTASYPGHPGTPTTPVLVEDGYCIAEMNCANAVFTFGTISGGTNGPRQLIDADDANIGTTYGTIVNDTNLNMGIFWSDGPMTLNFNTLIVSNNAIAFGSIQVGSEAPIAVWTANNFMTAEQDFYLSGNDIEGRLYDDSPSHLARIWLTVLHWNGYNDAMTLYGNDFVYLSGCQKIANLSPVNAGFNPVIDLGSATSGQNWLQFEKITQYGNGPWINFNTPGTTFVTCQQYEEGNPGVMPEGFAFGTAGSTNVFYGGIAACSNTVVNFGGSGPGIAGPPTAFNNFTMTSQKANPAISIKSYTNNLTLMGVTVNGGPQAATSIACKVPSFVTGIIFINIPATNILNVIGTLY